MIPRIFYKAGYKYQLQADYIIDIGILGYDLGNQFCKLLSNGTLKIFCGYAWDGPSGPTIDTKNFIRASLIHDVLYQLMRECGLPHKFRSAVDDLLYAICREDGMNWWRAKKVLAVVKLFGDSSIEPKNAKPVLGAP